MILQIHIPKNRGECLPLQTIISFFIFFFYMYIEHEEHVTNNLNAYRIFPLKRTIISSSELSFSVRALISATVTYYTSPGKQTPCLIVSHNFNN